MPRPPKDSLAEINGVKPDVLLQDGEEKPVMSKTSGLFVYRVKRMGPYYHCTCPAWKNQQKPNTSRTCRHMKYLFGEAYEDERIKRETGGVNDEDEENLEDDDELAVIDGIEPNEWLEDGETRDVQSASSRSKTVYKVKRTQDHYHCTCPAWRNQKTPVNARTCKHLQSLLGEAYEEARLKMKGGSAAAGGPTSKPAPKAAATKPSSKAAAKPASKTAAKPASKTAAKPASKSSVKPASKTGSKRKKADSEAEDEDEDGKAGEEDEDEKPPAKRTRQARSASTKPSSKSKPSSTTAKGKGKAKVKAIKEEDEEKQEQEQDGDDEAENKLEEGDSDAEMADGTAGEDEDDEKENTGGDGGDELAEINGVKPKAYLKDGDEKEVKSASSNSMYKIKRTWDHYYCNCPAWRNQSTPVNARTCKHLKGLLGDAYESERLKFKDPHGQGAAAAKTSKAKATKGKGKKKAADGDDDAEDDEDDGTATKKSVPELLLAQKWDVEGGVDPTGYWISEKLDGVRAYYDGKQFWSRLGNGFTPPKWFLETLPKDVTLDGELFGGRQKFQDTVSIVKTVNSPHWKGITFEVFDIPSKASLTFEKRLEALEELFGENGSHKSDHVHIVEHEEARDKDHVLEKLKEVEELGGEGLMLRKPGSQYEGTRSTSLLKVKTFYDAEAVVTGYVPGKGRNVGVTGALKCKMASGKTFNVGTGLSDKQRKNPPKVGTIIVYRFQELMRDKVPRFPSFIGEAADKTEPKDADIPVSRIAGAQPTGV